MSVKIDNAKLELTTKRAGKAATEISSASALAELYTTAQLNHIAEKYLGRTFKKVARKKMAEKIFPVLEQAQLDSGPKKKAVRRVLADSAEEATSPKAKKSKKSSEPKERKIRKYILHNVVISDEEKIPPQCRTMSEIFAALAGDDEGVEKTKEEILEALEKGGFVTKGNAWNNVMFYRTKLIELGVMDR